MDVLVAVLQILLGIVALLILGTIVFPDFFIPLIAFHYARLKGPIWPVEENTVRWIVRGGKAWRCVSPGRDEDPQQRMIGPHETWPVLEQRRDINEPLRSAEGPESRTANAIDKLLPGALRWKGFGFLGYEIKKYDFRWSVLREQEPGTGENGIEKEDGITDAKELPSGKWIASFFKVLDYIYLRDSVYVFELDRAETKELMPIRIIMLATMRVVDPYLPLFQVHDWLVTILNLIEPIVRAWVKAHCYDDVVGKQEVAEREFDDFILSFTGLTDDQLAKIPVGKPRPRTIADYVEQVYGVRIKRIGFAEVIPPEEYSKAATRRVEALQNREATLTNADAEAKRRVIIAKGEAEALQTVVDVTSKNPDGIRLRELEAAENLGENGNVFVMGGKGSNLLFSPREKKLATTANKRADKGEDVA